jgi:hypothetical protein
MLGVTKAMGAVLLAAIFCSLTTTAGQPTANPAGDDLGPLGHGLGQTISADGRYTTLTSGSGVQLIDMRTGKRRYCVLKTPHRRGFVYIRTPPPSAPTAHRSRSTRRSALKQSCG